MRILYGHDRKRSRMLQDQRDTCALCDKVRRIDPEIYQQQRVSQVKNEMPQVQGEPPERTPEKQEEILQLARGMLQMLGQQAFQINQQFENIAKLIDQLTPDGMIKLSSVDRRAEKLPYEPSVLAHRKVPEQTHKVENE